jgi:hypothetical protein
MSIAVAARGVAALALIGALAGIAQVGARAATVSQTAEAELTPEEKKERDLRRACKIALCSTLHSPKPVTGQINCHLPKTWPKETLTKVMAKGGLSWPWGDARCVGDLKLSREIVVKALTEPEYEAQFEKHEVRCELERDKDKYQVKVEIEPKVTFKGGRAVKAKLNWGKIEAPALAKTALWSAKVADNTLGFLQSTIIEDINNFIDRCADPKEDLRAK